MRSRFALIKKIIGSDRILIYAAYFFAFTFALWPFLASVGFAGFVFFSLFHLSKRRMAHVTSVNVFLLSTLFILYVLNLTITTSLDRGLQLTYRVLPIFVVPVLLYLSNIQLKLNYNVLKIVFIVGVILSCLISICVGAYHFNDKGNLGAFFYFELGAFFHLHPTYYALFILIAIHFLLNQKNVRLMKFKTPILLLFILFIFLLQVKIALLGLSIYLLVYVFIFGCGTVSRKRFLLLIMFLTALILIGSQLESNRFNEIFKNRTEIVVGNKNEDGVYQRMWLWKEAYIQIKEKPWLGFGLGSQNSIFRWKVEKNNLESNVSSSYSIATKQIAELNLHNQYFQTIYELGVIGGLIYLASIFLLMIDAIKKRKVDFIVGFSFFLLVMLTENLLERQMGIYFYAFILTLLYFEDIQEVDKNKCKRPQ